MKEIGRKERALDLSLSIYPYTSKKKYSERELLRESSELRAGLQGALLESEQSCFFFLFLRERIEVCVSLDRRKP